MIRRLWFRYMADISAAEQVAREADNFELLKMIRQVKRNRIWALCMAVVMLVLSTAMLWRHL